MNKLNSKAKWLFALRSFTVFFSIGAFVGAFYFFGTATGQFPELLNEDYVPPPSLWAEMFPYLIRAVLVGVLPIIIGAIPYGFLSYKYYRYQLSPEGFKKEYGIITKHYVTIPYDKIQNVDIQRSLLARILGLSELRIQTAGDSFSGSGGLFLKTAEGVLPGVTHEEAEKIREELLKRIKK